MYRYACVKKTHHTLSVQFKLNVSILIEIRCEINIPNKFGVRRTIGYRPGLMDQSLDVRTSVQRYTEISTYTGYRQQ